MEDIINGLVSLYIIGNIVFNEFKIGMIRNVLKIVFVARNKIVHPDDLKSLEDIAKFPYTTKQDLRDNYPFGMFAVPMNQVVRVHASSGTTGKPTVVGYTQQDVDIWAAANQGGESSNGFERLHLLCLRRRQKTCESSET